MTLLAALVGAVLISFSAIFFALSEASPVTGAFFRTAYALPVLFLVWFARRSQDRRPRSRHWIAIGAGLALAADMVSWHSSIGFIGTGLATLIANTAVIFVALGAWLIFGERPSRTTVAAIPFILVGVTLVSGLGQGDAFGTNPVAGVLLALLAAVFYATFLLAFRHSNDERAPAAGPLMEATLGAAVTILVMGLVSSSIDLEFGWPAHGWLLALALGAQVVAWLLIGYALPRLPAVETATIILIQPALTMAWGALIFDERPSTLQIIGAITVLAGVAFVAVARARKTAEPAVALPVS
ncbi:MAG TPA: DMT family transporter [Acidimicrobiia bacterium]|nr:DMT family transporter [Acidimicrobiia bacterium]